MPTLHVIQEKKKNKEQRIPPEGLGLWGRLGIPGWALAAGSPSVQLGESMPLGNAFLLGRGGITTQQPHSLEVVR